MSDDINLRAYQMNGYSAPDRCEMCNAPLPDEASRRKHMDETRHRACPLCEYYVPVGGYYGHIIIHPHPGEQINDHMVVHQDNKDVREAQPWSVAEDQKL